MLAIASIDKLSKYIVLFLFLYHYFLLLLFLFSVVLRKGFLRFEYESDQEGEKTHILVETAGL